MLANNYIEQLMAVEKLLQPLQKECEVDTSKVVEDTVGSSKHQLVVK
jgi:hypothetical protein